MLAVLGGIGALIAQAKGGSAWVGFALGFFLGPIGWIISALAQGPATKTCPKCAEKVKLAASVCRHCGHQFEVVETQPV